jgi:hypothetical protein
MHVYVCMYVCMYVCAYMCSYVYMWKVHTWETNPMLEKCLASSHPRWISFHSCTQTCCVLAYICKNLCTQYTRACLDACFVETQEEQLHRDFSHAQENSIKDYKRTAPFSNLAARDYMRSIRCGRVRTVKQQSRTQLSPNVVESRAPDN